MKRILNTAILGVAALIFSFSAGREVAAVPITLNLVQQDSAITITGYFLSPFGPFNFRPQEGNPGTSDADPTRLSNSTTYQGTITVDVDNVNNPSLIQILGSAAAADTSGTWLPEIPPEWVPGSDFESTSAGTDAAPAVVSDYGIEIGATPTAPDIAYAAFRDVVFNVTTLGATVPVVAGQFSSLSENLEISNGYFDYWGNAQAGVNLRGRSEEDGADDDNLSVIPSSYIVTMLPNNKREIKLTIPIQTSDISPDVGDVSRFFDGQFVATLIVPEPSTFALSGLAMAFAAMLSTRRRK